MSKIKQTAGRDFLGDFAPEFTHFYDDILFGENWNNQDIDLKTRSIVTIVAWMSSGITDQSLVNYLDNSKKNGVSQKEIAAIITHVAFYSGWSKAWAVFNLAKEIWEIDLVDESSKEVYQASILFTIGHENTEYKNISSVNLI